MTTKELNYNELQELLQGCYGTESYFKHSLAKSLLYTDGVKTFAENAGGQGAYWFIDMVASNMNLVRYYNEKTQDNFFTIKLEVNNEDKSYSVKFTQPNEDGKEENLIFQNYDYTDLQLKDGEKITTYNFYLIKSYVSETEQAYILLLPSEY